MSLHIMDVELTETTSRNLLHYFRMLYAFTQRDPLTEIQVQMIIDYEQYFIYREINQLDKPFQIPLIDMYLGKGDNNKICPLIPDEKGTIGFIKLKED